MTQNDEARFLALFTGLCEYFDKKFSDPLLEIYFESLKDMPYEQVDAVISMAIRTLKFFPKICELREMVNGRGEDRALIAWEQLQEAMQRAGRYNSVLFADPKISRVVNLLGGWLEVCNWPTDEMKFRRQEFLKAYAALPEGGQPEVLPGITETENAARGWLEAIPKPVRIGGPVDLPKIEPKSNGHASMIELTKAFPSVGETKSLIN
ncbi:MAG: DUF6475 domain-containing protein [Acidobacteriota bacterium]